MSRLENQAKRIIAPMILGKKGELVAAQQLTVALWSTKTAMVFDAINREPRFFFSQDERTQLRDCLGRGALTLPLPNATFVWLASYAGDLSGFSDGEKLHGYVRHEGEMAGTRGYAITIAAGAFVTQVLVVRGTGPTIGANVKLDALPGPWTETTVQLWPSPSRLVGWPPARALNDEALDRFANRWPRPDAASLPASDSIWVGPSVV